MVGLHPDPTHFAHLFPFRVLRPGQFTSLITNFENLPLNSVKTFKRKDLVVYDAKTKGLQKIAKSKSSSASEGSEPPGSQPARRSSSWAEEGSEEGGDGCRPERLFIGIIDINKREYDARVFTISSLQEEIALRQSFGAWSSLRRETRYYKAAWYSWGA